MGIVRASHDSCNNAAPHQELPSAALAACRIHATDRRNEEVGGVNQKVVTECQLRMALTPVADLLRIELCIHLCEEPNV